MSIIPFQAHHLAPTAIVKRERLVVGQTFFWFGQMMEVVKVSGNDDAAPVVLCEHNPKPPALPGQLSLWSLSSVEEAMIDGLSVAKCGKC